MSIKTFKISIFLLLVSAEEESVVKNIWFGKGVNYKKTFAVGGFDV